MHYEPLPADQRPLLGKFHRDHRSGMRIKGPMQAWVARDLEIVGALSLVPMTDGHWLRGLFVAPLHRGRSIASTLVTAALETLEGNVWLFCDPDLAGFYQHLGFANADALPPGLAERLSRYRKTKTLIALVRQR